MDNLINFDDMKAGKAAVKKLVQAFTRAGSPVASTDIDPKTKRSSGVNYRQMMVTMTDNQVVTLGVKTSGDIFEVKVNGSVLPIKEQGDQRKAVGEIVKALDSGRAKFQAKLARQKVALPKGITTAAPRMEQRLAQASADLDTQITAAQARVTELKAELGDVALDGINIPQASELSSAARDVLEKIDRLGPQGDGDIPSKSGRDELVERGLVERVDGDNILTAKGKGCAATLDSAVLDAAERKLTKKQQEVIDFIKHQINIDLTSVATNRGSNQWFNVDTSDRAIGQKLRQIESLGLSSGRFTVEPNGRMGHAFRLSKDKALDAVDVPTNSFDIPEVIEAQRIVDQVKSGVALDGADFSKSLATLYIALDTVETNHPINLAEGNIEQAELEERAAEDYRRAISELEAKQKG